MYTMYKLTELQRRYLIKLLGESKRSFRVIVHDILLIENVLKNNEYDFLQKNRLNTWIVPSFENYKKSR